MDIQQQEALSSRILSGLTEAQENRKKSSDQFNIDNWLEYWRAVSTNPTNQWYDTQAVRQYGRIESTQGDDPAFRVSINYIAQEVLNMVASDLLNPLRWRVRFKFFDPNTPLPLNVSVDGEALEIPADKYLDRINDVLNHYLSREKLNINDARLRLYNLRYKEGSSYLTLDWDAEGGPRSIFPKRKRVDGDQEKWDVLAGEWTPDGQYFKIPKPPQRVTSEEYLANVANYPAELADNQALLAGGMAEIAQEPEMIPAAEFLSGENFREDVLPQGDPKIAVYGVTQVWWELEPGEISAERIKGVYILDYITKAQAVSDYPEKDIYGVVQPVDPKEYSVPGDPESGATGMLQKLKNMFGGKDKRGNAMIPRIRYRRKATAHERRSQWFTMLGKTLVRAMECPYGKSFDISLGIYPFFARPSSEHLEGIPDIAYMIQPQVIANAIDSLILSYIESFPYGTYTAPGGDEPNTNVTQGGGPKIITSDRPLTANTPVGLGTEVFTMKADMRYMIQYFGRANQLQPGTRSQDASTAYQASVAQAYGQKLTNFNQYNDAGSWQMFLNDVLTLLRQFVKERRMIPASKMESMPGPQGNLQMLMGDEFEFTSEYLAYVNSVVCEPEDLQKKTDEESKRDVTAMLQMMNPGDPAEAGFAKILKRRFVELMNEAGIEYPKDQVLAPGAPIPGAEAIGDMGPGLAQPETPAGQAKTPENMPLPQKEAVEQITQ
jgi:hypothetical protein